MDVSAQVLDPGAACRQCGTVLAGAYCQACGQPGVARAPLVQGVLAVGGVAGGAKAHAALGAAMITL